MENMGACCSTIVEEERWANDLMKCEEAMDGLKLDDDKLMGETSESTQGSLGKKPRIMYTRKVLSSLRTAPLSKQKPVGFPRLDMSCTLGCLVWIYNQRNSRFEEELECRKDNNLKRHHANFIKLTGMAVPLGRQDPNDSAAYENWSSRRFTVNRTKSNNSDESPTSSLGTVSDLETSPEDSETSELVTRFEERRLKTKRFTSENAVQELREVKDMMGFVEFMKEKQSKETMTHPATVSTPMPGWVFDDAQYISIPRFNFNTSWDVPPEVVRDQWWKNLANITPEAYPSCYLPW